MRLVDQQSVAANPASRLNARRWLGWFRRNPAVVTGAVLVALFLLAPWPFAQKMHAALHGLCAQRPSHSFSLGGQVLPFDARMTGIYGGFLVSFCYLLARGRVRAWRTPARAVLGLLAVFVLILAVDGTNSTLRDFGLWYAYEPDNRLRLATGLLTGISLATLLCYLLATTVWRDGSWSEATIADGREVALLVGLQLPLAIAVLSGFGVLYAPVSLWLMAAAIVVFAAMAFAVLTMMRRLDHTYRSLAEMQRPLAVSIVLGLLVMGSLAGMRFLLEWWFGIPTAL